MIRTKGEAGTGDVVNAVRHMRAVFGGIRRLDAPHPTSSTPRRRTCRRRTSSSAGWPRTAASRSSPSRPGGIATPADAALCMQLGADGVFVGSGIFKSGDPLARAKAIVEATTHFEDAEVLARVTGGLGEPMVGISASTLAPTSCSSRAAGSAASALCDFGGRVLLSADAGQSPASVQPSCGRYRRWCGRPSDSPIRAPLPRCGARRRLARGDADARASTTATGRFVYFNRAARSQRLPERRGRRPRRARLVGIPRRPTTSTPC